ncbi:DUF480 domain-containing protein [Pseudonocardia humida]|uniref:DUF480 domain-containing protein n=1 Tax=Pseudonocardia humida TaxID=2800819 RepID=A0ABT1A052_9PSEU|nr:DUF480 domain-containing protein [Pseudonocardia humida]MCO1656379.1 DUF480 domain-containing protein [Pseudonocardia humida]
MAESRPQLSAVEQRVLGALLEKQRTVPASYPLTLNALRTACNQASNRDPVTEYDDSSLQTTLKELRDRELVRPVWTGAGSRVVKFHQRLEEHLGIGEPELAVLTVLLLRGPQTPGELRTRTARLHPFGDRSEVEAALRGLAGRPEPLVVELERRAGQQDRRWAHLLGPLPEAAPPPAAVDRDVVIAAGADARNARVLAGYDAAAAGYARGLSAELAHKPFDCWLLDRIAAEADGGPVADVGTGPGHVAARLAASGASVIGVDLSPAMVDEAGTLFPDVEFEVGDLANLLRPRAAAGWAAITAWYAFVHMAGSELPAVIAGLARVLVPGGRLAFALHVGEEVRHVDELFGAPVDLDFVLHDASEVVDAVTAAGLVDIEWYLRSPLPDVETPTDRLYVLARRPR